MTPRFSKLIFVVGLLTLLMMCGKKGELPIANVGGRVITLTDFEESFTAGKAKNVLETATDSMKLAFLDRMVDDQLLIVEAYRQQLEQDSSIDIRVKRALKDRVARKVWDQDVVAFVVPESEIKELYKNQQKEVRIRDIVLRFVKNDSVDTEADVKDMIERIHEYLKDGASFDSLARRYSQDRISAAKGGDKGFLKWSSVVADNEVYKKAFQLPEGEISSPFKQKDEYHIIQVEEIRPQMAGEYKIEKQRIINQLFSRRRPKVEERRKEMVENLMTKYNGQFVDENINLMVEKINGADATEDSIRRQHHLRPDMFSNLSDEDTTKALYLWGDGMKLSIGYVVRLLKDVHPNRRPPITTGEELKNLVERMLLFELFAYEGKQRGYMKDEEVLQEISRIKEDAMLKQIKRQEIDQKVNPTEEDLIAYYEANREKYFHPERRDVQEIWITEASKAQIAFAEVKSGRDFSTVADKYNERASTKKKSGRLGLINENQYGDIGKKAFEMQKGEVSELIRMGRNFSIVKVLDIKPPEQRPFEEVKFQVRNEVRAKQRDEREKELLSKLREDINVTIYQDRLLNAFKSES